jgi:hypothetical protein
VAGITTLALANRYLREHFLPAFNGVCSRPHPADLSLRPARARRPRADPLRRARARRRP